MTVKIKVKFKVIKVKWNLNDNVKKLLLINYVAIIKKKLIFG